MIQEKNITELRDKQKKLTNRCVSFFKEHEKVNKTLQDKNISKKERVLLEKKAKEYAEKWEDSSFAIDAVVNEIKKIEEEQKRQDSSSSILNHMTNGFFSMFKFVLLTICKVVGFFYKSIFSFPAWNPNPWHAVVRIMTMIAYIYYDVPGIIKEKVVGMEYETSINGMFGILSFACIANIIFGIIMLCWWFKNLNYPIYKLMPYDTMLPEGLKIESFSKPITGMKNVDEGLGLLDVEMGMMTGFEKVDFIKGAFGNKK